VDLRNVALLLAAVALLWTPRLRGPIDLRYDGGVYYVLGTSLAEGRGYRLLNEPGEIEAVQYPPLLPAVVAAAQRLLGTGDSVVVGHALRLLLFLLSLAHAAAAYAVGRQFLGPGLALLAALLAALHHFTVFLSDLCFTEVPFTVVTLVFLLAARRGATLASFALGSAAVLLRTPGIALLAAWVAEAVLRRRLSQAAVRAALSFVPVLLWGTYVAHVTRAAGYRPGSYAYQRAPYQYYNVSYAENLRLSDPFRPEAGPLSASALASRVVHNIARLPLRFGEAVSGTWGDWEQIGWALGRPFGMARSLDRATVLPRALLGLAALGGLVWLARRGEWLLPLYVCASYLLTATTPWPAQFARYLAPLAPFLTLALAGGIGWVLALPRDRWRQPLVAALAALVGATFVVQVWALAVMFGGYHPLAEHVDRGGRRAEVRLFYHGPEWRSFDDAVDWLRTHTTPGAVVATTCPQLVFLRAGRRAVMPPMEPRPEEAQRLLDTVPAAYVVLDGLDFLDISRRYAEPAIAAHPALWQLVYEHGGVRVYARRSAGRAGAI
jgi:hypothetical protein